MILGNLEPKNVMKFFEEISSIPRASKHERQISDYLVNFAKTRHLEVTQDEALNVVIKKGATPGYEKVPTVILQGHMDMVPEKNMDTNHNFDTDGIKLRIDGDFIKGTGTTLGADNGIAVAMSLAILDSNDIPHPALEVLFTTDEEMGMSGAGALDGALLKGRILINVDTEEEGCVYVSCAGGSRSNLDIPVVWENKKGYAYQISIRGLVGAHSGLQIHEQHGNSNKLLGRFLREFLWLKEFNLVSIAGGSKENAVPRESDAIIVSEADIESDLKKCIEHFNKIYKSEFSIADKDVSLSYSKAEAQSKVMDKKSTHNVLNTLMVYPYGVKAMSLTIPGLVQTSVNPGVVVVDGNAVSIRSTLRSSVKTEKDLLVSELKSLAEAVGGNFVERDSYPAWQYAEKSKIRDLAIKTYKDKHGKEPEIKAVHAGLECGILGEKFEQAPDTISMGPNIFGAHTPEERMSIKSTKETWDWLLTILKATKDVY